MNYYLVIHTVESFLQHDDMVGYEGDSIPKEFAPMQVGDRIVYYCKGDGVITGTYRVVNGPRIIASDAKWEGPHTIVKLKALFRCMPPYYVPLKLLLNEMPRPLSIFPKGRIEGIRLRGRTVVRIKKRDFSAINRYLSSYAPKDNDHLFQGVSNEAGLGKPWNLGVMNYAPTNEQGVVALFVCHMKALGFEKLEFIRQGFPDACALQQTGETFSRKFVEFEYRSSQFRQHVNDETHRRYRCDYIVCWEHDYLTCPVKVIELRKEMRGILSDAE